MWAGTGFGLLRYRDGQAFPIRHGVETGLPSARITALTVDGKGRLWVGTEAGAACQAAPAGRTFERVETGAAEGPPVTALATDAEGAVWIGAADRLYRAAGPQSVVTVHKGVEVTALSVGKAGDVWVGTRAAGVWRFAAGRLRRYAEDHGLAGPGVAGLTADPEGPVLAWAGDTVSVFDGAAWFPYRLEQKGVRWDVVSAAPPAGGGGWLLLTPFGFQRLRRAQIPDDPVAARQVLAVLDRARPRVAALDVMPAPPDAAGADEDAEGRGAARAVVKGLPPLPALEEPDDPTAAAEFQRTRLVAERARAAYQRAATDRAVLAEELEALRIRKESADARVAETRRNIDLARSDDEQAAAAPELATELADGHEEARRAGVAYELMAQRAGQAEVEAVRLRMEAVRSQEEWAESAGAGDGDEDGGEAEGDAADDGPAGSGAGVQDAEVVPRTGLDVPRLALSPEDGLRDVAPTLVTSLRADGDRVFIGTRHAGLLRAGPGPLAGDRASHQTGEVAPERPAAGPVADALGHVWVVERGGRGLLRFDGTDWRREAPDAGARDAAAGAAPGSPSVYLGAAADGLGRIAVLSATDNLWRVHRRTLDSTAGWDLVVERIVDERPDQVGVLSMAVSEEGDTWLALELPGSTGRPRPEGVLVLKAGGGAVNHRQDLALAVGGANPGLALPSDRVTAVALNDDGGVAYLGTYGGLCVVTGDSVAVFGESEGLSSEIVRDVVLDKAGRAWIASSAGAAVYDPENKRRPFRNESKGLPSKDVGVLHVAPEGILWALTAKGPALRDPAPDKGPWLAYPIEDLREAASTPAQALAVDRHNRLWLRTRGALLARAL